MSAGCDAAALSVRSDCLPRAMRTLQPAHGWTTCIAILTLCSVDMCVPPCLFRLLSRAPLALAARAGAGGGVGGGGLHLAEIRDHPPHLGMASGRRPDFTGRARWRPRSSDQSNASTALAVPGERCRVPRTCGTTTRPRHRPVATTDEAGERDPQISRPSTSLASASPDRDPTVDRR